PEATYSLGYSELQGVPLARVNGDFSYEELIKRYFNKFSVDGERVYVKDTLLDGNPAKEYQYKTSKANFVLRVALVDDRVYELLAELPFVGADSLDKVITVLDSVKLMSKTEVESRIARKVTEATPAQLPQTPIPANSVPETNERNLKGRPRTVLTEVALYAFKNSLRQKHP